MHPDFAPLATGDGFEGLAVGAVKRSTFVVVDRPRGELPRVSTAPAGGAAEAVAAFDAPDGSRVAVIAGAGLSVPVVAGDWLQPGDPIAVGPAGQAVLRRDGVAVGRAMSAAQPGGLVEVARTRG